MYVIFQDYRSRYNLIDRLSGSDFDVGTTEGIKAAMKA